MSKRIEKADATEAAIEIRECTTIDDFDQCVALQCEVFGFPDIEASPRRHFIVSRRCGGWALGAFHQGELVGFVHQLVAIKDQRVYGYSHMLAVNPAYQNMHIGARLKWAQRERTLAEGNTLIRWTWDPLQARNAHFNLNRLGVVVRSYLVNFYGIDYSVPRNDVANAPGIDSDRLFAEWDIGSERVESFALGGKPETGMQPALTIEIPPNWNALQKEDTRRARSEQLRVRGEFETAFAMGLVCSGFERDVAHPRYLLYETV